MPTPAFKKFDFKPLHSYLLSETVACAMINQRQILFATIAFLIPVAAYFSNIAMAPLAALSALGVVYLSATGKLRVSLPPQTVIASLFALLLWAAISSGWSLDFGKSISGTLKLFVIFLLGYLLIGGTGQLDSPTARKAITAMLISYAIVLIVFSIDIATNNTLSNELRSLAGFEKPAGIILHKTFGTITALMVWPILGALTYGNKRNFKSYLFIAIAISLSIFVSLASGYSSGVLAILAGTLAVATVLSFGHFGARIAGHLMLSCFVVIPVMASYGNELADTFSRIAPDALSALHRLYIWDAVANLIGENVLVGWGRGSAGLIPAHHTVSMPLNAFQKAIGLQGVSALPLHTHNAILQIFLDLGVIGAAISALAFHLIYTAAIKNTKDVGEVALICGLSVTAFVIMNLSFSVWQSWWLSTLWIAASMMSLSLKARPSRH